MSTTSRSAPGRCRPRHDEPPPPARRPSRRRPARRVRVFDRDETIGRNKPFKDLAWGLASRGVAVLRFDKVTFAHSAEVKSATGFTVADEYVPHALAAVELLRQHRGVDPSRIFLLGHSLGGTVAPRVAAREPSLAGLAILAGGAEPMQWSIVRQVRYLASLDPDTAAVPEHAVEALAEQARLVDSPELSESTPAEQLPLRHPRPLLARPSRHSPVAVAASLDCPIFLLQGGRDYQVTVEDDLERWKAGPRRAPQRDHPRLPRRQPPVLLRHRPLHAGRI